MVARILLKACAWEGNLLSTEGCKFSSAFWHHWWKSSRWTVCSNSLSSVASSFFFFPFCCCCWGAAAAAALAPLAAAFEAGLAGEDGAGVSSQKPAEPAERNSWVARQQPRRGHSPAGTYWHCPTWDSAVRSPRCRRAGRRPSRATRRLSLVLSRRVRLSRAPVAATTTKHTHFVCFWSWSNLSSHQKWLDVFLRICKLTLARRSCSSCWICASGLASGCTRRSAHLSCSCDEELCPEAGPWATSWASGCWEAICCCCRFCCWICCRIICCSRICCTEPRNESTTFPTRAKLPRRVINP